MDNTPRALVVFSLYLLCLTAVPVYSQEIGDNKDRPLFRWVTHDKFGDHVIYSDLPPVIAHRKGIKDAVTVVSAQISSVFKGESTNDGEGKDRKLLKIIKESGISIDSGDDDDYGEYKTKTSYVGRILPGGSVYSSAVSARGMV
ncbi:MULTISPECIES: hypothetical protein [Candidatus Ichthyocystis]|uniref:Putative membrane protein n=1 Tax=Candidatus Ichthyocystis hellenicum TaxID=1561003 RepID=A0A0S4M2Y1_9BURK|nr:MULTISPECIES: hypothetical protein [Ichthyocystis]CUT18046.1 putative membrane protein [Candidatus Ichthyocystis hellenicum]